MTSMTSPHYIREQSLNCSYGQLHTGWLLSADRQAHLMFVPPDARLPDPSNILTIPPSAVSYVDFSNATLGSLNGLIVTVHSFPTPFVLPSPTFGNPDL